MIGQSQPVRHGERWWELKITWMYRPGQRQRTHQFGSSTGTLRICWYTDPVVGTPCAPTQGSFQDIRRYIYMYYSYRLYRFGYVKHLFVDSQTLTAQCFLVLFGYSFAVNLRWLRHSSCRNHSQQTGVWRISRNGSSWGRRWSWSFGDPSGPIHFFTQPRNDSQPRVWGSDTCVYCGGMLYPCVWGVTFSAGGSYSPKVTCLYQETICLLLW